jgi:methyltransferase (TIGR00027 family)
VTLGAGYDGRALRFRAPGVQFFEVDHPATQLDKRQRLEAVGAPIEHIVFVAADFTQPGLGAGLADAGHERDRTTLFICEGVLRYLPEDAFRALLAVAGERAAPGSVLAVSISTRERGTDEPAWRVERDLRLAEAGEPVLTVPPRAVALQWLSEAGWTPRENDVAEATPNGRRGRLLVHADR